MKAPTMSERFLYSIPSRHMYIYFPDFTTIYRQFLAVMQNQTGGMSFTYNLFQSSYYQRFFSYCICTIVMTQFVHYSSRFNSISITSLRRYYKCRHSFSCFFDKVIYSRVIIIFHFKVILWLIEIIVRR